MPHNMRHQPPYYRPEFALKPKLKRLRENDMTLCMAAISHEDENERILICSDKRVEVGWAGANVAFKARWAADKWPALIAGDISKADDFLATCHVVLNDEAHEGLSVFDRLNEASCAHKQKLAERHVRKKLGINFQRFLTKGENELTPEVRNRLFYEIEHLEFGCEVIVMGFQGSAAFIYSIDEDGEVCRHQDFAAIGSGSVMAQATIYQRALSRNCSIQETLYILYEAARLAEIAPGVGPTTVFVMLSEPRDNLTIRLPTRMITVPALNALDEAFKEYGPKADFKLPELNEPLFFDFAALFAKESEESNEDGEVA